MATQSEKDALPDVLRPGLALVFVGTAAGRHSAAVGAYYAHPGNRFWPTLHKVGLTPRLYRPHEFPLLLDLGIGFTDVAKRASGMDHEISHTSFDPAGLAAKIEIHRPRVLAFTSKRAASYWFGRPTRRIVVGLQDAAAPGHPIVFVLPSPSGAAGRYWAIEPWRDLAAEVRSDRSRAP